METIVRSDIDIKDQIAEFSKCFNTIPGVVTIQHLQTQEVLYMSDTGLSILKITMDELRELGADYHKRFFNQEEAVDYVPKIYSLIEKNDYNEYVTFFQEVRANEDEEFTLWFTAVKLFIQDKNGSPLCLMSLSLPVVPEHNLFVKIERLLAENKMLRENYEKFSALTKREKEVLKLAALGMSNQEISEQLHLSCDTVKTHRKNINRKLKPENQYDLLKIVQALDLV